MGGKGGLGNVGAGRLGEVWGEGGEGGRVSIQNTLRRLFPSTTANAKGGEAVVDQHKELT